MGAVTGAHSFLNTVTMATINPPSAPTSSRGATSAKSRATRKRYQVQAAVAKAQISRIPVLFTVPLRVMRVVTSIDPPYWLSDTPRNVLSPRAGFEVFIRGIEQILHRAGCALLHASSWDACTPIPILDVQGPPPMQNHVSRGSALLVIPVEPVG